MDSEQLAGAFVLAAAVNQSELCGCDLSAISYFCFWTSRMHFCYFSRREGISDWRIGALIPNRISQCDKLSLRVTINLKLPVKAGPSVGAACSSNSGHFNSSLSHSDSSFWYRRGGEKNKLITSWKEKSVWEGKVPGSGLQLWLTCVLTLVPH